MFIICKRNSYLQNLHNFSGIDFYTFKETLLEWMDSESFDGWQEKEDASSPNSNVGQIPIVAGKKYNTEKRNKKPKLTKEQRKAQKKSAKSEQRLKRAGDSAPPTDSAESGTSRGSKPCSQCGRLVDLLIRCQHAGSDKKWVMLCGKCWKIASGGVVDGDAVHALYRYGGLWKNRKPDSKAKIGGRPPSLKAKILTSSSQNDGSTLSTESATNGVTLHTRHKDVEELSTNSSGNDVLDFTEITAEELKELCLED